MTSITVKQFKDYKAKLFDKNGGDRSFSIQTERCYDKICPFSAGEETNIRITHPLHDVHQLADTFLYLEFSVQGTPKESDTVFLGWRDASQIFKTLRVYSNNNETGYWQRECTKEGLLKTLEMCSEQAKSRLYESSDLDQVYEHESCCGTYVTMTNGTNFTGDIKVVIPIASLLPFEHFKDVFAPALDITLKFALNMDSMVVGSVRFGKVNLTNASSTNRYSNRTASTLKPYTEKISSLTLTCTKCVCECYGYNVTPDVKQSLFDMSQQPLAIPCRKIEVVKMPDKFRSGSSSYVSVIHHALDDVSKILIMTNSTKRITYSLYQLYIDGQVYPNSDYMQYVASQRVSSGNTQYVSGEHARFAASYIRYLNPKGTIRPALLSNMIHNGNANNFYDFCLPFQLRRNTTYEVYDGKDTQGTQVPLEVRLQTEQALTEDLTVELWLIRDCAWTIDANGLKFDNHAQLTGDEINWLKHRPEEHKLVRNIFH